VLSQTQASDLWAFYQAKSIKGYILEMQKNKLELELLTTGSKASPAIREVYDRKIAEYTAKVAKYEREKAQLSQDAKKLEAVRDDAQKHSRAFGIAVIFLQIAILLSSIAALIKKKYIWVIGLGVGIIGIIYFADGFLLFI
jgi:hypothetical protein